MHWHHNLDRVRFQGFKALVWKARLPPSPFPWVVLSLFTSLPEKSPSYLFFCLNCSLETPFENLWSIWQVPIVISAVSDCVHTHVKLRKCTRTPNQCEVRIKIFHSVKSGPLLCQIFCACFTSGLIQTNTNGFHFFRVKAEKMHLQAHYRCNLVPKAANSLSFVLLFSTHFLVWFEVAPFSLWMCTACGRLGGWSGL